MTSINLVLRPSSRGYGVPGSLYLRIIHDRRVKMFAIPGCKIFGKEWDRESETLVYPRDNPERTSHLREIEKKIHEELDAIRGYVVQLEEKGFYTVEELAALYRLKKDDGKLLGYAELLARTLEANGQYRTAKAYRTAAQALVKFNKGADIPLGHINSGLIREFANHLREGAKLPNTIAYYIRNLRAIYNKAVKNGRVANRHGEPPFAGVSTAVSKTMKRALSLDELRALHKLDFQKLSEGMLPGSREREYIWALNRSWRYFFFCLYSRGMCFVDMAYLRKENIRGNFIRYCRKKTGQQIEIRVTDEMGSIIDSFAKDVIHSPYVFPIISEHGKEPRHQYESALRLQNIRLLKLARLAGVKGHISTHVARHSWATVSKQMNVPVQVISECLGHTSPDTTMIYLAMLDNCILDDANTKVIKAIIEPSR